MSRVKVREAWVLNMLVDELDTLMKEYLTNETTELGEDQKRSLIEKAAKSKASFTKYLKINATAMSTTEAELDSKNFVDYFV
jgi:hypothetical protein